MASFTSPSLRYMGFCGADDSANPELLQLLSLHYSWVEWGVLFRPDLEGSARYPKMSWVQHLCRINKETGGIMHLAGHLCGSRCQEVLDGNFLFVESLYMLGFGRVQINATQANNVNVDKSKMKEYASNLRKAMAAVDGIEWIMQRNEETKELCDLLVISTEESGPIPSNMSFLFDSSCGKGIPISVDSLPPLHPVIPCGYAGGIGPATIFNVLQAVQTVAAGRSVWVDMESSLRTRVVERSPDGEEQQVDVFDVTKCFLCIQAGARAGLPVSRFTLLSI